MSGKSDNIRENFDNLIQTLYPNLEDSDRHLCATVSLMLANQEKEIARLNAEKLTQSANFKRRLEQALNVAKN